MKLLEVIRIPDTSDETYKYAWLIALKKQEFSWFFLLAKWWSGASLSAKPLLHVKTLRDLLLIVS